MERLKFLFNAPHLVGALSATVMAGFALTARLHGQYDVGVWIAVMLCLSAAVMFTVWRIGARHLPAPSMAAVLGWAFTLRFIGVLTPAFFEDDYYRYLWDGYRTLVDGNPYFAPPANFFGVTALSPALNDVLSHVNYPHITTIYGPALQHLFHISAWVQAGALWPWQALLITVDMALVVALARSLGTTRAMLYVYCPIVIHEIAVAAHPDGLLGALAFAACWLALNKRVVWAAVCAGTAMAMKVHMVLLLPFVMLIAAHQFEQISVAHSKRRGAKSFFHSWRAQGSIIVATLLAYAAHWLPYVGYEPYAHSVANAWQSFATFARLWQFNAMGYAAVASLVPTHARVISLVLIAATVAACFWWLRHRANRLNSLNSSDGLRFTTIASAIIAAFGALLFFAPVINPWYLLWLLPLACATKHITPWVAATVVLLSYATDHHLGSARSAEFLVPLWAMLAQVAAISAAFACDVIGRTRD